MSINDILEERLRQDQKWGEQNHAPIKWNAILMEEVGEVSKAILEEDYDGYRDELIQVAAVALAALECLDRYEAGAINGCPHCDEPGCHWLMHGAGV